MTTEEKIIVDSLLKALEEMPIWDERVRDSFRGRQLMLAVRKANRMLDQTNKETS